MATNNKETNKLGPDVYIVESPDTDGVIINAIKNAKPVKGKTRLFLDVDGTLIAMQYNPDWKNSQSWPYNNVVYRTDFCHWINSIYTVLNKHCEVIVLTNYTIEDEKNSKVKWLEENLKCDFTLVLNKEGIAKGLYVNGKQDILVDDTLPNLDKWNAAGGSFFAAQYVSCEKGRRELLEVILNDAEKETK